jgi:hypothetical protein
MRRRLLLAGWILLLAIPLVLMLRNFARDVLLEALGRLLWVGRVLLESVAQEVWWFYFLVFALLVALRSLFKGGMRLRKAREAKMKQRGQIEILASWIQHAVLGDYFKRRLAQHLGQLTLEVLDYEEKISPVQLGQRLSEGNLDLPPEILALLQTELTPNASEPAGLLAGLRAGLQPGEQTSTPNVELERVVRFLEDRLEVQYDDHSR